MYATQTNSNALTIFVQLSETKSADSKTTLLHYLVKFMRANMPSVLDKCETMFRCAEPVSRSMSKWETEQEY